MNRINPLYLGGLLIVVLLLLLFKLNDAKGKLAQAKEDYKSSVKLSVELSSLKKVYSRKPKLPSFRSAKVVQKRDKSGVTISSKSIDIKTLNSLMGKILNGAYNVTRLNIKRVSDTKASLYMEIKW